MARTCFKLVENCWFAWQMLPGYSGKVPYFSPIFVHRVKPLKTGKGLLRVEFYNAFYAEGVRNFSLDVKVIVRSEHFLVGEILCRVDEPEERVGIISRMSFDWLSYIFPELSREHPHKAAPVLESVNSYLDRVLGRAKY
jgi:hypothetical protein